MNEERRKVNEWQLETDLKLDTLREDVDGLKGGQEEIKAALEKAVTTMSENTELTKKAVTFAENLEALNKLASWATTVGKVALPIAAVWATFKGWVQK